MKKKEFAIYIFMIRDASLNTKNGNNSMGKTMKMQRRCCETRSFRTKTAIGKKGQGKKIKTDIQNFVPGGTMQRKQINKWANK